MEFIHVTGTEIPNISNNRLRLFIDELERLEKEKKIIMDQIRDVYKEITHEGLETTTIRQVLKIRKMKEADINESEILLSVYLEALGMKYPRINPIREGTVTPLNLVKKHMG